LYHTSPIVSPHPLCGSAGAFLAAHSNPHIRAHRRCRPQRDGSATASHHGPQASLCMREPRLLSGLSSCRDQADIPPTLGGSLPIVRKRQAMKDKRPGPRRRRPNKVVSVFQREHRADQVPGTLWLSHQVYQPARHGSITQPS
jgi:hypothetical protein